jgi:hypothetical protein
MACPWVADGTTSSFGGLLRKYWLSSRRQTTGGGPPAWGLGVGLTTPHRKKNSLRKATQSLGPGWILLMNNLSEGIWTGDLARGS